MEVICRNADFVELSSEILGKGNCLRFCAKGCSMYPFIRNGDVIRVKKTSSNINIGDIIFYRTSSGSMVVHRVVRKYGDINEAMLLTKGDACLDFDEPIHKNNIIGKVTAIERGKVTFKLENKIFRLINFIIAICSILDRYLKKCILKKEIHSNIE